MKFVENECWEWGNEVTSQRELSIPENDVLDDEEREVGESQSDVTSHTLDPNSNVGQESNSEATNGVG